MALLVSCLLRNSARLERRCIPLFLMPQLPPQPFTTPWRTLCVPPQPFTTPWRTLCVPPQPFLTPWRTLCVAAPKSQPPRKSKLSKKSPVTWQSLVVTGIIGAGLLAFMFYVKKEKEMAQARERKRVLGKADIGGRFELIDYDGTTRKSEEFLGQWLLLYFGFTHCPDVCPDELEKMAMVVDDVEKLEHGQRMQPLFITVDPARDTKAAIKEYCREFHPRLLGLTGTDEKIAEACRAYRVYFSAGPHDDDGDYIVDHTIIIYLINPDGDFVDYFGQNSTAGQVTASITFHMKKFEDMKKSTGLLGGLL